MLRQSKISINFIAPVLGKDIQDESEILSNRHWVVAEVMVYNQEKVSFFDYLDILVAEWFCKDLSSINIPQLNIDSPVVTEQKSYEYQAVVKKQRPAAWSAWTSDEENQLIKLYEQGLNYEEIAEIHQRTAVAIYERLCRLGIYPEHNHRLGNRPQKRHYEKLGIWNSKVPGPGESVMVCLGCGFEIAVRPCKCWKTRDTSDIRIWREHRFIYSDNGSLIGKNY